MKEEYNTYDIYYDEEGDFLEISFGLPADEGTTEEIEQGIFITKDVATNEIKNVGILDFKKRAIILKQILDKINLKLPINISVWILYLLQLIENHSTTGEVPSEKAGVNLDLGESRWLDLIKLSVQN